MGDRGYLTYDPLGHLCFGFSDGTYRTLFDEEIVEINRLLALRSMPGGE